MASRRCSDCAINWPADGRLKCPGCGGRLSYMSSAVPLGDDEAKALAAELGFAMFLADETPDERRARRAKYAAEEARREAEFRELASQLQSD